MTETEFLAPTVRPDEDELDRSLRPRRLDEFVGQERVKEQLAIALEATRSRGEALDHLLLIGPPGSARRASRSSSARSSASASARPPARRSSARATWPRS